jgi:alkylation response protein AidB-like acyl-CoA dehydrogenase
MDFEFTDAQRSFHDEARVFAAGLNDGFDAAEKSGDFRRTAWDRCAGFGLLSALLPPEYGGRGMDVLTYAHGLEGFGETCLDRGLAFAICAHVLACEMPILGFGNSEQKKRWLPALAAGRSIAAVAIAEEHGASDAFNLRTRAVPVKGGYSVTGTKCYVTNGPFCDLALVFAALGDSRDVVCLVAERGMKGFLPRPATPKMGLRTSPFGELVFKDCAIPESNRLGAETSGKLVFMSAMEWERGCLLAPIVGGMARQLNACLEWARSRVSDDGHLCDHQAVSHRLADMHMRLEVARLLLYRFAWKKQTHRRAGNEAAMAKLHISEAMLQNSLGALSIHGAHGYTEGQAFERDVRDALGATIASGTSDIQRNVIAKWLRL